MPHLSFFGLPPCLQIPIAAKSLNAIEEHVGTIKEIIRNREDRPNALLIEPHLRPLYTSGVPLWQSSLRDQAVASLHPQLQVWVNVDFSGYRRAYASFNMPAVPPHFVLDHVANRKAMRTRGSSHPFLRLSAISQRVNTNAGGVTGAEGLERTEMLRLADSDAFRDATHPAIPQWPIMYADPMDITKMLNVPPGTYTLSGVRDTQRLFYPVE